MQVRHIAGGLGGNTGIRGLMYTVPRRAVGAARRLDVISPDIRLRGLNGYDICRRRAYCTGRPASRKIEQATVDEVPYRVLAANQHPDRGSIAAFRQQHLAALAGRFVPGRALCQRAGLVTSGHVAPDGTKARANTSKHKTMSDGQMVAAARKLEAEVAALLTQAQAVDAAEDARYGRPPDAGPCTRRRHGGGGDADQTPEPDKPRRLRPAQDDRGPGARAEQGHLRLPPLLGPQAPHGRGRMAADPSHP